MKAKITILEIDGATPLDLSKLMKGLPAGAIVASKALAGEKPKKAAFAARKPEAKATLPKVAEALKKTKGNRKAAAKLLGVSAHTVNLKAKMLGVPAPKRAPHRATGKPLGRPRIHPLPKPESVEAKATRLTTLSRLISSRFPIAFGKDGVVQNHPNWKPCDGSTVYCPITGQGFSMITRHFRANFHASVEDIRDLFGLTETELPATAPLYAKAKSDYAKAQGLGSPEVKAGAPCPKERVLRRLAANG